MEESTRYLLIGGGPTSVWAAQNIRERDPEGGILILCGEKHPPYDKPPLSKQYLLKDDYQPEDAYTKFDHFYPENRIQLNVGRRAVKIERDARIVTLEDGHTIRYEKLLLATGASPRKLDIPGASLNGIFYLRTLEDSEAIRNAMQHSRRAVMIGAGYIGMEVAAACSARGLETTVIETAGYPWARFASPTMGHFLQTYLEERGVKFLFGEEPQSFVGEGAISAVRTASGKEIPADFVVVGVGATLNSELAKEAGLEIGDRGGVVVNEYLHTSDPNIWAAGDIALFNDIVSERQWHIEHHQNAKWQGRAVGAIMAGEQKPYNQVPYFFSDVLDIHMALRGAPSEEWKTTTLGNLNAGEFVELYFDHADTLRMGIAISHEEPKLDPASDKLEELIRAKAKVTGLTAADFGFP
jgi:3-phenylpropionate/trans-cinnamate dioxygenase ferredoxin reductase subunit